MLKNLKSMFSLELKKKRSIKAKKNFYIILFCNIFYIIISKVKFLLTIVWNLLLSKIQ